MVPGLLARAIIARRAADATRTLRRRGARVHRDDHATGRRSPGKALEDEAVEHERAIREVVSAWRPDLQALTGVGPVVAATILAAM